MLKCPKCNFEIEIEIESMNSLRIHASKKHNLSSEDLYLIVVLNGNKPTCECGCGSKTKFNGLIKGYSNFSPGHVSRIRNNWGHNKKAFEKSLDTRRNMWKNGQIQSWCKGLTKSDPRIATIIEKMNTPERAEKISKSLTGKSKSESHKQKISKLMKSYWSEEINRERQSFEQAERIKDGLLTKCTRIHGNFNNHKKSTKHNVYYRSLFELNAILYLESNESVISYTIEPYRIEYDFEGKTRHYVIDCLAEYKDGTKILIEFKPNCYLSYQKNISKFKSAEKFANINGFKFEIWTEKTHPFLQNVPSNGV